jgi:hypothetical protein
MTIQLVRKPASATAGGELGAPGTVGYIDSSGNWVISPNGYVGVGGTNSGTERLRVHMPANGTKGVVFRVLGQTNNPGLWIYANESTTDVKLEASGSTSASLVFGTSGTEAGRINQSQAWTIGPAAAGVNHDINGTLSLGRYDVDSVGGVRKSIAVIKPTDSSVTNTGSSTDFVLSAGAVAGIIIVGRDAGVSGGHVAIYAVSGTTLTLISGAPSGTALSMTSSTTLRITNTDGGQRRYSVTYIGR